MRIFIFLLLLLAGEIAFARRPYQAPDTARIRRLCDTAEYYLKNNQPDSARHYAQAANVFAQQQKYEYGLARVSYVMGKVYTRRNELDSASAAYEKARDLTGKDSSYQGKRLYALATGNLSTVLGKKGFPDKELQMLLSAIPLFESLKDSAALSVSMYNIASKFINAGQPLKAYPYLMKNIALAVRKGQPESKAYSFITAGTLFLQLDSLESAGHYLSLAAHELRQIGQSKLWGALYTYMAVYKSKKGAFKEAEQLCRQAEDTIARYPDKNDAYNLLTAKVKVYTAAKKYPQAIAAATGIYNQARKDNSAYFHLSSLKDLYELENKAGHLQASFNYLEQYVALKDSLDQRQMKLNLNDLEQRYQVNEKQRSILELTNQNNEQKLALQQSRFRQLVYLFILTAAGLLLLLLFITLRTRQRISRQQQQLLEQELARVQQEKQIENYVSMLNGQEQERSRLARELHDGLGGKLSAIYLHLSKLSAESGDVWSRLHGQLADSMKELRHIARNLTPETLSRYGLAETLKDYCQTLKDAGINIILQVFNISTDIPYPTQLMLYRIVQEAITNAIRHANANRILVQCSQQDNIVYITVEDDGRGFDAGGITAGNGLANIKARINHLNGQLEIRSFPGTGTIINIECKLP